MGTRSWCRFRSMWVWSHRCHQKWEGYDGWHDITSVASSMLYLWWVTCTGGNFVSCRSWMLGGMEREEKPSMVRCHLVPLWFWRMVKECLPNESLLGAYIWSFFGSRRAKGRWYPSLQWFIEKDGDEKGKGEWERDGYREGKKRDKEMLKQSNMFICAYF